MLAFDLISIGCSGSNLLGALNEVSVFYTCTTRSESTLISVNFYYKTSVLSVEHLSILQLCYCILWHIMKSIPSNLPLLREFFFLRPFSLTNHVIIYNSFCMSLDVLCFFIWKKYILPHLASLIMTKFKTTVINSENYS